MKRVLFVAAAVWCAAAVGCGETKPSAPDRSQWVGPPGKNAEGGGTKTGAKGGGTREKD